MHGHAGGRTRYATPLTRPPAPEHEAPPSCASGWGAHYPLGRGLDQSCTPQHPIRPVFMSDFLPARSQKVGLYSMSEPIPTTHSPPPGACTPWARGPERLPKGQAGLPRSQNAARRLWARNRKRSEAVHNRSTRRQLPSKLPLRACTLQPTRSDFPQVGAGVGRFAGLGLAVAHPRRVEALPAVFA